MLFQGCSAGYCRASADSGHPREAAAMLDNAPERDAPQVQQDGDQHGRGKAVERGLSDRPLALARVLRVAGRRWQVVNVGEGVVEGAGGER